MTRLGARLSPRIIVAISLLAICAYAIFARGMDWTEKGSYDTFLSFGNNRAKMPKYRSYTGVLDKDPPSVYEFEQRDIVRQFTINNNGSDVLIFLRVQKTGSTTLSRHLGKKIDVSAFCNCSGADPECPCYQNWLRNVLFAYYNPFPCGLHTDWTLLHTCAEGIINKRHHKKIRQRHLYITMVREPLRRYLSEWLHVQWRATWRGAPLRCGGRSATLAEVPPCYKTYNWAGVSLKEFMNCSSNLAINRQTRMLAELTLVNCYNTSTMSYNERHYKMVKSAMENLKSMAYFGLTEHQELSQIMFENTFNIKFRSTFVTSRQKAQSRSTENVTEEMKNDILYLNRYDVMLYKFAKTLFQRRVQHLLNTTNNTTLKGKLNVLVKQL